MAPPASLTPAQRKLWEDVLLRAPHGLLRHIDLELMVRYVKLLDRYDRADRAQRRLDRGNDMPFLINKDGVLTESPYLRALDRMTLLTLRLQTEMGFTPASRARIGAAHAPVEEPDQAWSKLAQFPVLEGGKAA